MNFNDPQDAREQPGVKVQKRPCFTCLRLGITCLSVGKAAKCATCSLECSLKASPRSSAKAKALQAVYSTLASSLAYISPRRGDETAGSEIRSNISLQMRQVAVLASEYGGISDIAGRRIDVSREDVLNLFGEDDGQE